MLMAKSMEISFAQQSIFVTSSANHTNKCFVKYSSRETVLADLTNI